MVTLRTTSFIQPKYIHTALQLICGCHMIYRTQRKYFLTQGYQVRYYNWDGLTLYRINGNLTSKDVVPLIKWLVADLWTQKPEFGSKTVLQGYVTDRMWQCSRCSFSGLQFYAVSIIANKLFTRLHLMSLCQNLQKAMKFRKSRGTEYKSVIIYCS